MRKLDFEPIPTSKISEHIEKAVKEAVLDGRLKPGDKLPTEKEMALQFGVSLVTLREGLRALEIFGLIEKKKGHGGGIFISELDNESIKASLGHFLSFKELSFQHIYEVRKIIEPSSIKLAAEKISPDEIKMLDENICFCEEALSKGSPSNEKFLDIDEKLYDFHRIIAECSRNPLLSLTIDYVLDFLRECEEKILTPDPHYFTEAAKDHRKLFECLKKGDGERCEKEMALHLKKFEHFYEFQEDTKIRISKKGNPFK
jgi:GntR family transcriptional regulator, transcriptional repressor for pyruvate dehydrogenase complex